jgi:hypothetical protein
MKRRGIRAFAPMAGVLATAAIIATPASAATGDLACQLSGTTTFAPGLSFDNQLSYTSFDGRLTNCQSDGSGPSSGTITAGELLTIGGAQYEEPAPDYSGTCAGGVSTGMFAIVQWDGGGTTVMFLATGGATAGSTAFGGHVRDRLRLEQVGHESDPAYDTYVYTDTYGEADATNGLLSWAISPADCLTGATSALTSGALTISSS